MKITLLDFTIFEDSTLKRLIAGIVVGLALGILLEIVLVVLAGSVYMPGVFFGFRTEGGEEKNS